MPVYRIVRKTRNFTQIENESVRDRRLSFRARGVLTYLISLPADAKFPATKLAEQGHEGKAAIGTAYDELEAAGYLVRERTQQPDGRWSTILTVYEVPPTTENQQSVDVETGGSPTTDEPTSADRQLKSNTSNGNTEKNTKSAPTALARKQTTLTPVQQAGEALIEACGWNRAEVTPNNLRAAMTAAADLFKLPDPPTPDEIVRRGYNYRVNHPEWAITPHALVKWWADSAEIRRKPSDREIRNAMRRQEWQNIGKGR